VPTANINLFILISDMTIAVKTLTPGRPVISRRWMKVAAAVGLVAYTLVFSELFIRLVAPQPIFPRYVTSTPWGVRGNIPGARYWHSSADMRVEFRINRWGMRDDRDFTLAKPPGVCRIALFGDSLMMGYELDLKDTFAARLEAQLHASGINAQVLNFSVSGFGTAEDLRAYEGLGRKFAPDMVIFGWNSTDLADNVRSDLYRLQNGRLVVGNSTYLPSTEVQDFLTQSSVYRWVAEHSDLYNMVRERAGLITRRVLATASQYWLQFGTAMARDRNVRTVQTDEYPPALATALLQKSMDEVEHDGGDFVVVDIPDRLSRTTFSSSLDSISRKLPALETVMPLDAFRAFASPDRELYYEHGEGHLTPQGVAIIVNLTANAISKSAKLIGCPTR
jgi:hypothetical protein